MLATRTALVVSGGMAAKVQPMFPQFLITPSFLPTAARSESAVSPDEMEQLTNIYDLRTFYVNFKVHSKASRRE